MLPAVSRVKKPDPIVFFAGGPGQSAMDLAGAALGLLSRLNNRRDVVLIDQRGTGRSAPLFCAGDRPDAGWRPLSEQVDDARRYADMDRCRDDLQRLPHGDLRQYTTAIAIADVRAALDALGVGRVNLVGGSYGTRMALEFLRQAPNRVRRSVLDGVAPPDMNLPDAGSPDAQAALDQVWAACESEPRCAKAYPTLRADWKALLTSLPKSVAAVHPLTGAREVVLLDRDSVLGMVRAPLYVPLLASALPAAVSEAAAGRWDAMVGLASSLSQGRAMRIATGMHFSVVCTEDLLAGRDAPVGADFGRGFADSYRRICERWPRSQPVAGFQQIAAAASPVWLLSGGADPVTPPRHGDRVTLSLGPKARHKVVVQAGHGVMSLACVREGVFRFIDAVGDDEALAAADVACAKDSNPADPLPRPPAFLLPGPNRERAAGRAP